MFEILPEAIFFQETNLICELSLHSFSYFFENDNTKKISGLFVFNFDKDDVEDISQQLVAIFREQALLHKRYKKIFILYSDAESVLLPEELYKPGQNELLLDTLFGDLHHAIILTDLVADKKIYNVYRMPSAIHQVIVDQFPLATFYHQHSLLIKKMNANDLLDVIIYENKIVLTLIKNKELQIIQTFFCQSADDMMYHLKNVAKQFNSEDVPVRLGGMIKETSELVNKINANFFNVTFDEMPAGYEFASGIQQIPSHYFSHLFSIALCV